MPGAMLHHWVLARYGSDDLSDKVAIVSHNPGLRSYVSPTEPPSAFWRFT
jgi:hypothetical protein